VKTIAPTQWIASEAIFGLRSGEERFPITVQIGAPYQSDAQVGEWACKVSVAPLQKARLIYGHGSLQPLCLAVSFAKMALNTFIHNGGRLIHDTGEDFALDAAFGSSGDSVA
jgi:hypothetical protein